MSFESVGFVLFVLSKHGDSEREREKESWNEISDYWNKLRYLKSEKFEREIIDSENLRIR